MSWPKCLQTETARPKCPMTETAQTETAQTETARPKSPVPTRASPEKGSCPIIFHCIEYTFYIHDLLTTCPENRVCPEFCKLGGAAAPTAPPPRTTLLVESAATVYQIHMKRSGDSTHSCRSPRPTAKGCDLTPSTHTQFLRKNTIIRRARTGPYFRKAFPEGPGRMIFRCRENMGRHLLHTPNISRKLLESENVVCNSTAATKNALGIFQLWFNYFAASFFKELGVHLLFQGV